MADQISESTNGCNSAPTETDLRVVAERFKPADFEPFVRKAADSLYETIMHACEDYLRENVEFNIGSHIQMLERENQRMRTELYEIDRALSCLSLGQSARLVAIKQEQGRNNQLAAALEAAHREIALRSWPIE